MQALKKLYISVVLFFVILSPSYAYSAMYPQSFGHVHTSKAMKKRMTAQNILKESNIVSKSKKKCRKQKKLSYYLYTADFIQSFIEIPTSNVLVDSSTISSKYLAGRAPVYDTQNKKVGTCSASFLCIQNSDNIFTDISNYLSIDNGLIISWFTPSTLANLELDSVVHSMVTECIVTASTKVGVNPFYGQKFNMVVSADGTKIYFNLRKI